MSSHLINFILSPKCSVNCNAISFHCVMSHANASVMPFFLQRNRLADVNDCVYEGQVEFGEEYVGHSEEKLEQMKEETEDKPGSELPLEKASVALVAIKLHRKILAAKEEV